MENDATAFEVIMTNYSQNYIQAKISVPVTFDVTTTRAIFIAQYVYCKKNHFLFKEKHAIY